MLIFIKDLVHVPVQNQKFNTESGGKKKTKMSCFVYVIEKGWRCKETCKFKSRRPESWPCTKSI